MRILILVALIAIAGCANPQHCTQERWLVDQNCK